MSYPSRKRVHAKKRSFFSRFRVVLGSILLIIVVALLALDPIKNHLIQKGQTQNQIGNLTLEQVRMNRNADVTYDWGDVNAITALNVISQNTNPDELPTIGGIAIPAVNMNLPIYLGVSDEKMYLGAGTLFPDQEMGVSNYSLASHHSKHPELLFAPLLRVEVGDVVYLTDLERIYEYTVTHYEIVSRYRVDILDPTEHAQLTLVTCDSTLQDSYIVYANLSNSVTLQEATDEMLAAFNLPQTIDDGTHG